MGKVRGAGSARTEVSDGGVRLVAQRECRRCGRAAVNATPNMVLDVGGGCIGGGDGVVCVAAVEAA